MAQCLVITFIIVLFFLVHHRGSFLIELFLVDLIFLQWSVRMESRSLTVHYFIVSIPQISSVVVHVGFPYHIYKPEGLIHKHFHGSTAIWPT